MADSSVRKGSRWLLASSLLAAGLLALAGGAVGRTASLAFNLTFTANGSIALTLPDGTPVGTRSGAPTVIPAGYYIFAVSGPMDDTGLPYFRLQGPNVDLLENLNEGGTTTATYGATFAPSSTYTWTNDSLPGVVYTFATSSIVGGAAPTTAPSPHSGAPAASQSYFGSAIVPFRGPLAGSVAAAGGVTLAFKGKRVTSLQAGRYRITVLDRSKSTGLTLTREKKRAVVNVSGAAFVGKRSASVDLTAGRWLVGPEAPANRTYVIVVR